MGERERAEKRSLSFISQVEPGVRALSKLSSACAVWQISGEEDRTWRLDYDTLSKAVLDVFYIREMVIKLSKCKTLVDCFLIQLLSSTHYLDYVFPLVS